MAIKPLADRILVQRKEEAEQKSTGGIIIPDTAKEKPQEAEVVEVGPGKVDDKGNRIPMDVKKKDRVLISKYGGTEIKMNGQEYLIIRADDVLAIID